MSVVVADNPFRNKTDLNRFVKSHNGAPTDDLVRAINIKLNLAISADNTSQHHRLGAGRMLLELRARVEAEGEDWWKWQEGKFDRSRKDMEKLMRMASADDPVAAEAEYLAKRRSTEPRGSKRRAGSAAALSDVDNIRYWVNQLTDEQRTELFTKLKEDWPCL